MDSRELNKYKSNNNNIECLIFLDKIRYKHMVNAVGLVLHVENYFENIWVSAGGQKLR